jgi:hypothetical protein
MGTAYRRADVVGSKRLKLVLLAAGTLAGMAPGLAHAVTVVPAATFYNAVVAVDPDPYPGEHPYAAYSTTLPTSGLAIAGSSPPTAYTTYSASTGNSYGVPSVSAEVLSDRRSQSAAGSSLIYYVEFGSTTASTVTMRVTAYGESLLMADVEGAYAGTRSQNNAEAALVINDQRGNGSLVAIAATSDLGSDPLMSFHTFSFDQMVTFDTNWVYQILIRADVTAAYQHEGHAYVDPYFYVPDGFTLFISEGIGNTLPNSVATPIPASLPLFVSGLGGLGYLARRRRKGMSGVTV